MSNQSMRAAADSRSGYCATGFSRGGQINCYSMQSCEKEGTNCVQKGELSPCEGEGSDGLGLKEGCKLPDRCRLGSASARLVPSCLVTIVGFMISFWSF